MPVNRRYYVAVKASVHSDDCSVFGLNEEEVKAMLVKFSSKASILNGIILTDATYTFLSCFLVFKHLRVSVTMETTTDQTKSKMSECPHNHGAPTSCVFQTLDELDFERGIWSAALKGDTERVEKLLKRHSDVDQLDGAGYTALHYASRSGHVDTVRSILAHGADVNAKTKAGLATALHRAAGAGQLPVVKLLMSKGAKIGLLDGDGQTALHRAALGGHTDVLKKLVTQQSLDLLAIKDVRGRTVLDCAQGQPSSVEFLKRFC